MQQVLGVKEVGDEEFPFTGSGVVFVGVLGIDGSGGTSV